MNFTEADIDNLILGILTGEVTKKRLPKKLYKAIAEKLQSGVFDGYGSVEYKSIELLGLLRENVWMFSAAKTYQQVREYDDILKDMSEALSKSPTFNDFKKEVLPLYEQYNVNWLQAEYNTAIGQARQAQQWEELTKDTKLFPYLRYSAVLDDRTSDICEPLDGIIAPVDDAIWNKFSPLNHFNCRCTLEKIDAFEDVELTSSGRLKDLQSEMSDKVQDEFQMNPGKSGYVFSPKHGYFSVSAEDKAFAKRNFELEIPE